MSKFFCYVGGKPDDVTVLIGRVTVDAAETTTT